MTIEDRDKPVFEWDKKVGEERAGYRRRFTFAGILKRYHIIVQEDLNDVRICQEGTLANESDLYQRGGTIDSVRNVCGIEGYKESEWELESRGILRLIYVYNKIS